MRKLSILFILIFFGVLFSTPSFPLDESGNPDTRTWEYYFTKGELQIKAGMFKYARASMERVLDLKQDHYPALNILASVALREGDRLRALDLYEKSLAIYPNQAAVHFSVAVLHEFFADPVRAENHLEKTIALDPGHHRARMAIVKFLYARGEKEKSAAHYRDAHERAKESHQGELDRASLNYRESRLDLAKEILEKICREAPALTESFTLLYRIFLTQKKYDDAVRVMEELVKMKPDHEEGYILLGQVYFTGRTRHKRIYSLNRAVWCYERAIALNPGRSDTYLFLADTYRLLGDRDRADRALKKGQSLEK